MPESASALCTPADIGWFGFTFKGNGMPCITNVTVKFGFPELDGLLLTSTSPVLVTDNYDKKLAASNRYLTLTGVQLSKEY